MIRMEMIATTIMTHDNDNDVNNNDDMQWWR